VNTNIVVQLADGTTIPVAGIGTVAFIPNCLHIPTITKDLISASHLDLDLGYTITHSKGTCLIMNKTGSVVASGKLDVFSGLYIFTPQSLGIRSFSAPSGPSFRANNVQVSSPTQDLSAFTGETKAEAIAILHNLCHYHPQRIQEMVKQGILPWPHASNPTNFIRYAPTCDACKLAKSTRRSFLGQLPVLTQVGRLWFTDVWGPNQIPSIRGNLYVVGFIESVSKMAFVYFQENKDVRSVVKRFVDTEITRCRQLHGTTFFTNTSRPRRN
jgi:hypothetical protein